MGTTESKISCTDRLRRQGKWVEASRYKEDVKQRHRDAGKSRQEANRMAWQAVQERFPAEDPPAIKTLDAALFRGIVDPPNSPQNREEITQIWLAFHLLQAVEIYRDLPTEEQPWARYRMESTFHVLRDCVPSLAQFIFALVEPSQFKSDAQAALQRQLEIMDESADEWRYVEAALAQLDSVVGTTAAEDE